MMTTLDIQTGMNVRAADGSDLGTVTEVWPFTETHGYVTRKDHEIGDYGPITGNTDLMVSEHGYFETKWGQHLETGETDLYIPYSAVVTSQPGESLTVDCTEDIAVQRYARRPEALGPAPL